MNKYIEEEITLAELADRFLGVSDFKTTGEYDLTDFDIEVETYDQEKNEKVFKKITHFIVKPGENFHYTDGELHGTADHKIVESGTTIRLEDHPEFNKIDNPMDVVDLQVEDLHTYLANGRLNHNTTAGGFAVGFHSSVRIRLKNAGQIKGKVDGIEQPIGMEVEAQVKKNRCGPPLKKVTFKMYFDRGIDDLDGWLDSMKDRKLINNAGATYTYVRNDSTEVKFMAKNFQRLLEEDPSLKQEMYDKLCSTLISAYKSDSIDASDIEVTNDIEGDL